MKVNFIIADEFRGETNGKVMGIGIYGAHQILLNRFPDEKNATKEERMTKLPLGLDRVGFMVTVSEVVGDFKEYLEIINPSGVTVLVSNKTEFKITKENTNAGHSFLIQTSPFIVTEIGTYLCKYYLNDEAHELPFIIDFNEQPLPE